MNRIYKTILVVLLSASGFGASAQNKSYISNHKVIAAALSQRYGIPAPVILSIAAIESSGGAGPAARVLNNHFGIVGKNSYVNDKGRKSRYKEYSNEIASYVDFCNLITRKSFYNRLKGNPDCSAWIKAISRCGYSEEPGMWEQKVYSVLYSLKFVPAIGFASLASFK